MNQNDMSAAIKPKSDQLNADDLIAGPMTIRITDVRINAGSEQPVSIHFEGDNGKPWKSCKSMNRLLVSAWGADASKYKGRSLTLYRDPTVKWGGMEVGGIRVSHMSDISADHRVALTATKGKRVSTVVKPLRVDKPKLGEMLEGVTPQNTRPDEFKQKPTPDFMAEWEGAVNLALMSDDPEQIRTFWAGNIDNRKLAAKTDLERATAIRERVEKYL